MFVTKDAYIASSLLENAVNLFDESIKITEVPDGTVYLPDCNTITGDALTVFYCGSVTIDDEISPEEIRNKLSLLNCGSVLCTTSQFAAVEFAATDCGQIVRSDISPEDADSTDDEDTTFVNTVKYQF